MLEHFAIEENQVNLLIYDIKSQKELGQDVRISTLSVRQLYHHLNGRSIAHGLITSRNTIEIDDRI
jgi:hypothetical protein